jgi:hypothetical protein
VDTCALNCKPAEMYITSDKRIHGHLHVQHAHCRYTKLKPSGNVYDIGQTHTCAYKTHTVSILNWNPAEMYMTSDKRTCARTKRTLLVCMWSCHAYWWQSCFIANETGYMARANCQKIYTWTIKKTLLTSKYHICPSR